MTDDLTPTLNLSGRPLPKSSHKIPLYIKLLYSAFVALLVPYYWLTYGPQNFLFFCDVALLLTLVGLWTENSLLISMQALAILFAQSIWVLDFLAHLLGFKLLGMTAYMFNPQYPLFVRALSLFHGWLPFFLLYLLHRLRYNPKAFPAQTLFALALLLICYTTFLPPTSAIKTWRHTNINYVFGMNESQPQTQLPPLAWFALLCTIIPTAMYYPTHLILSHTFRAKPASPPVQS